MSFFCAYLSHPTNPSTKVFSLNNSIEVILVPTVLSVNRPKEQGILLLYCRMTSPVSLYNAMALSVQNLQQPTPISPAYI